MENSNYNRRVFETVRAVNQAVKLKSRSQSPQNIPGSSPSSTGQPGSSHISSPHTSLYESNPSSNGLEDKLQTLNLDNESTLGEDGERKPGTPGTPGCRDLQAALQRLSLRQQASSEKTLFDQDREQKLNTLVDEETLSSGLVTPAESVLSTGTNYSGSSGMTGFSGFSVSSRPNFPDKLKIVKPLEGEPMPCFLQAIVPISVSLSFCSLTLSSVTEYQSSNRLPDTQSTYTITTCRIMHPLDELTTVTLSLHHTPTPSCASAGKLRSISSDGNLARLRPISSCGNFDRFWPTSSPGNFNTLTATPTSRNSSTFGTSVSNMDMEALRATCCSPQRKRYVSESATNLREHTITMSTSLGLVTLLKEHGISAAMYDLICNVEDGVVDNTATVQQHSDGTLPSFPSSEPPLLSLSKPPFDLSHTSPPQKPFLTSSLARSMLNRMVSSEDRRSPSDTRNQRNIFSLNLVEKLKRLGLDKVVARGMVNAESKRLTRLTRRFST
ncbi:trafficking kinesin-binding protein 1-like [Chiloscyllium plagiosum]|uniref:trafficking kinesin-binding protein 1-like n=1 Tax=Chiloscyllium plagiosum TaxID=36176 RepID=UPI001CB7B28E|nr:trafficking kinesin-binding protein 1-like [Chiloscyllium plagiosum]